MGEEFGEVDLEDAELVGPRVAEYPEVVAALLLVVPAGCAERFESLDLGLDVVGFEVEVHAFFAGLLKPSHKSWKAAAMVVKSYEQLSLLGRKIMLASSHR